MYWGGGLKLKRPRAGEGGACSSVRYLLFFLLLLLFFCFVFFLGGGGSDVFHWSLFSVKVIASEGDPQISQYSSFIHVMFIYFLNHWGAGEKMYPCLVKKIFLFWLFTFSFRAFNNQ